jgi:plasmid stability protein
MHAYIEINLKSSGDIMKTITLRGVDENLENALRKRAQKGNESINKTILNILKKATGQHKEKPFKENHDLDELAGTWTQKDANEFNKNTEFFNQIDPQDWK